MAGFNLRDMLSEHSKETEFRKPSGTVYRDVFELVPSKENFYGITAEVVRDLKNSIQLFGVMQDISIQRVDGKDRIISGHRRTMSCRLLVEEGHEEFRKIGCKYTDFAEHAQSSLKLKDDVKENPDAKEAITNILENMAIIQANRFRDKTDWERMQEVVKTEHNVQELRKYIDLEGKTRDMIRETLGYSGTQIARYQSINNNLPETLMKAFEQNRLNVSVAAEIASLNEKYQTKAHEMLEENGQITLNEAKFLKSQQEQERDIPGQMTIDQALHPHKPEEINIPVPVDIQIDRFYESLKRNIETYIKKSDLNMTVYMLSALYGTVRVRNGQLNYQGTKEGILFNTGSEQEELMSWTDFSKKLIEKYGKKQKPVKMTTVDKPEEKTRTGFTEKKDNLPVQPKCITGQSRHGFCGTAAYCEKPYNCCTQCPEDCNIRCGWLEEHCRPVAEPQNEKQQSDFTEPTKIEEHSVEFNKKSDHTGDSTDMLVETWPEFLKDIPVPTDTELKDCLEDQESELRLLVEIKKESPELPHTTVVRQQMVVAGLRLLGKLIENMEVQDE